MYKTILIPTDGSGAWDIALPWVLQLARDGGSAVHLVRVIEPGLIGILRGTATTAPTELDAKEARQAREALEALRKRIEAEGVRATSELLYGPPVAGILKSARVRKASLIVLAKRHRPGLRGLLHGSTSAGVLHREPRAAMLIVHEARRGPGAQRIVVPLDGTAASERVLPHVCALADVYGSEVTLVRVLAQSFEPEVVPMDSREEAPDQHPTLFSRLGREQFARQVADARETLQHQEKTLREAGVTVSSVLLHGPVVAGITKVATEADADLVALTSHTRGGGTLFGGIAAALLNRMDRPVLVVRP